ncbi:MAG: hypothetical protein IPM74_01740 [Crocinitomicaceae bacterium]|nr:hypothetical protein [Crocinitomicaceae bacterium]MBK8924637.1 hypothetical protein [Crocinitomicaceae bacterium]
MQLIMLLGTVFGLFQALRLKNTWSKAINWTMVIAVGLTFVPHPVVKYDAYYLYILTQFAVLVYAFSMLGFSILKKICLITSGLMTLSASAGVLFNMHGYEFVALSSGLIHLAVLIFALRKESTEYKEELGFLAILGADAITRVIGGALGILATAA